MQLPANVSAFTGRGRELATLDQLLSGLSTGSVILCISGTAGVGKTALAIRWAHLVRDRFPDGQLYVNMRGYDPDQPADPAEALAAFLNALSPGVQQLPLDLAERAARYRTAIAGRRMLILLDNAATVDQVRPLLPGADGCVIVVTSRDSLAGLVAVDGARRIDLDLLPPHDSVELLRRLIGPRIDAVPEVAAALADRCGRLPLALRVAAELAVSRPADTLPDLLLELQQQSRLDLLSGGEDKRATVRAVFSWSIEHLSADAARTFVLLGLHPGVQFDTYAVAALFNGQREAMRRVLDALTRAHLIHPVGPDRYSIHDLLRAYAIDLATAQTDRSPVDGAVTRLYDYYLATAAAAMECLHPGEADRRPLIPAPKTPAPELASQAQARSWLDTEMDNLVAVASHASPGHTMKLSMVLFRYLDGGHDAAAITVHGHARDAARRTGDRAAEAHALNALGGAHTQAGRHRAAVEHLSAALAHFRHLDDRIGQARALGNLGGVEERLGQYGPASEHYRQAASKYLQAGDRIGEAHALTRLGTVEARLGRQTVAVEHLRRALSLHRQAGHCFGEAWALTGIGEAEARTGRGAEAAELHRQALALFRGLGHRSSEAWALDSLGSAETLLGRLSEASTHHGQALALFRELGDRAGEAWSLNGLGEADTAAGQAAQARSRHIAALAISQSSGARDQKARAHAGLARTHRATADLLAARSHYARAVKIYADLGNTADAAATRAEWATLDDPAVRDLIGQSPAQR
jgi:tetratricopeptide (TPR) repeat protein